MTKCNKNFLFLDFNASSSYVGLQEQFNELQLKYQSALLEIQELQRKVTVVEDLTNKNETLQREAEQKLKKLNALSNKWENKSRTFSMMENNDERTQFYTGLASYSSSASQQ